MTSTAAPSVTTRRRRTTSWWVLRVVGSVALLAFLTARAFITFLSLALRCADTCSSDTEAEAGVWVAQAWVSGAGVTAGLVALSTWWSLARWARRATAAALAVTLVCLVAWVSVNPAV